MIAGVDEELEVLPKLVVVAALDGGVLDGAVHPLDLAVGARVVGLGETVLDAVLSAGKLERVGTEVGQVRDRGLERVKGRSRCDHPSSGSGVWHRNATTTASSAIEREVDLGSFGPVGGSAVDIRFFHFATVFWLTS